MSATRKPQDRLEALLSGLEDEVLLMEDRAALSPDEGGATTDVGALRSSTESVIEAHSGVVARRDESLRREAGGPSSKVARALELLGRLGGAKQSGNRPSGSLQVRMAFSGKREPTEGETTDRRSRRARRGTESEDKES